MNAADWAVLLGTIVGIAAYGFWRTRHVRSLNTYMRGDAAIGWGTIGLSVMATHSSQDISKALRAFEKAKERVFAGV